MDAPSLSSTEDELAAARRALECVDWRGLKALRCERGPSSPGAGASSASSAPASAAAAEVLCCVLLLLGHRNPVWEAARVELSDPRRLRRQLLACRPSPLPVRVRVHLKKALAAARDAESTATAATAATAATTAALGGGGGQQEAGEAEGVRHLREWAECMYRACVSLPSPSSCASSSSSPLDERRRSVASPGGGGAGGAEAVPAFRVASQQICSGSVYPFEAALHGVLAYAAASAAGPAREAVCVVSGPAAWRLLLLAENNVAEKVFSIVYEAFDAVAIKASEVTDAGPVQPSNPAYAPVRAASVQEALAFLRGVCRARGRGSVVVTVGLGRNLLHLVAASGDGCSRNSVTAFRRAFFPVGPVAPSPRAGSLGSALLGIFGGSPHNRRHCVFLDTTLEEEAPPQPSPQQLRSATPPSRGRPAAAVAAADAEPQGGAQALPPAVSPATPSSPGGGGGREVRKVLTFSAAAAGTPLSPSPRRHAPEVSSPQGDETIDATLVTLLKKKRLLKRVTCADTFGEHDASVRTVLEAAAILLGHQPGEGWDGVRAAFVDPAAGRALAAAALRGGRVGGGGGGGLTVQARRRFAQLAAHGCLQDGAAERAAAFDNADPEFDALCGLLRRAVLLCAARNKAAVAAAPALSASRSRSRSAAAAAAAACAASPTRPATAEEAEVLRQGTWRSFVQAAARDGLTEQDLENLSFRTLEGLVHLYGFGHSITAARIELCWMTRREASGSPVPIQ